MAKKTSKSTTEEFDYKSIKTFEDACKKTGIETTEPEIKAAHIEPVKAMIAYYKLVIIFLAINNGWKPDWSDNNQWKYYPWFYVLSSGFGFADSGCGCAPSGTIVGSRLCFESEEKADYAEKQFAVIYKEFLI